MTGDMWVFAYGSLMWRPGFDYLECRPGLLTGYHRAFCVYSHHWRGTPQIPGLVLGLGLGGECRGQVFRVAEAQADMVVDYLTERELISYAYKSAFLPVALDDGRMVEAWGFVADPLHRQYAGDLGLDRSAEMIMEAEGLGGLNRDYLINTVQELEALGFVEPELHILLKKVEELTGLIDAGGGI